MDDKFYYLDNCPYCNGEMIDAGKSNYGNQILHCTKCGVTILEKDIEKIREGRRQDEKKSD